MSVCGQSGQTEEDSASEEVGAQATRDIYKQKPASKVVRVLTVLAYLLSVSLAAILLSVYYICVWKSPDLPLDATLNETGEMSAQRSNSSDYRQEPHASSAPDYLPTSNNIYGGGDSSVNGDDIRSPQDNITSGYSDESASTEQMDVALNTTGLPDTTPLNGTSDDIGPLDDTDSIT